MAEKVLVNMLRQHLTDEQRAAIIALYPAGTEIEFVRTDPIDCDQHADLCDSLSKEHGATVISVLPKDRPIPAIAMERGVAHIAFMRDGSVGKLEKFDPKFNPFSPKSAA